MTDRAGGSHHAPAPLSVATDLTLTVDDVEAEVRSTGERLFVEFSSLPDAVRVARSLRGVASTRLERFDTLLRTADLTLEVRVRDRTVAVLGSRARPGVVSARLGIAPVEVRLGAVLGTVGRELSTALETLTGRRW